MAEIRWYEKPIAALGAVSITYHEVLRGRRVGICSECGRTNHATAERCLCGGGINPVDSANEHLDDPSFAEYDSLATPTGKTVAAVLKLAFAAVLFYLVWRAVQTGEPGLGWIAIILAALYGRIT